MGLDSEVLGFMSPYFFETKFLHLEMKEIN